MFSNFFQKTKVKNQFFSLKPTRDIFENGDGWHLTDGTFEEIEEWLFERSRRHQVEFPRVHVWIASVVLTEHQKLFQQISGKWRITVWGPITRKYQIYKILLKFFFQFQFKFRKFWAWVKLIISQFQKKFEYLKILFSGDWTGERKVPFSFLDFLNSNFEKNATSPENQGSVFINIVSLTLSTTIYLCW